MTISKRRGSTTLPSLNWKFFPTSIGLTRGITIGNSIKALGAAILVRRYRVFGIDFDTRALLLELPNPDWDDETRARHEATKEQVIQGLAAEFGPANLETKVQNFKDLGPKPFSVVAFHNKFLTEARGAFVLGSYYPALTAATCLGERVLNHLLVLLRGEFATHSATTKKVLKDTCDNWGVACTALFKWGVLTSEAKNQFAKLHRLRNNAVHFRPETDHNARAEALNSIITLQKIVDAQFSPIKRLPWLFQVRGESYIRRENESDPFVRYVYLPNCLYVTPTHSVKSLFPWKIEDTNDETGPEVTDEEYAESRRAYQQRPRL